MPCVRSSTLWQLLIWLFLLIAASANAEPLVIVDKLVHLRAEGPREWTEFPEHPDGPHLEVRFPCADAVPCTLEVRQQDVKQDWNVLINRRLLGKLVRDENDMRVYFSVPADALVVGENLLRIEQAGRGAKAIDDIRVGQARLHTKQPTEVLAESTLEILVTDGDSGVALPCRVTIVGPDGALQSVHTADQKHLAVRPGVVYTATGRARIGLPAGIFTIYAGRGFEYSLDSKQVSLAAGKEHHVELVIRREVPTEGYVASDTHVHTLTYSGHGDATIQERMITLAAEGIELPIATDHNLQIDYEPFAREMGVRQYFTPVVGNEVTTRSGHFNIFPARAGGPLPDHKLDEWRDIFAEIKRVTAAPVVILNHARDVHSGTRPFGPELYNAVVGENLAGWKFDATAMEVINSGATQTDATRLFHDWMAMLNRGHVITPVGASDSHDVARHFVGQGRTYVRCHDGDAGNLDVAAAVASFVAGRVFVSYGLLAELNVNDRHGPGETVAAADEYDVRMRVLGPHWTNATRAELFANGERVAHWDITRPADELPAGVKWQGKYRLKKPKHDVFLTLLATGPGVEGLYWKTAKAYQPTSPEWTPQVLGISGAVWLDADGDGRRTPAHEYARREFNAAGGDLTALITALASYDRAVAAQAAHLVQTSGVSLLDEDRQRVYANAAPAVQAGFRAYLDAWRENQQHRANRR